MLFRFGICSEVEPGEFVICTPVGHLLHANTHDANILTTHRSPGVATAWSIAGLVHALYLVALYGQTMEA